jgi:glycosyltransferase involved in cell wall biosynthesis
MYWVKARFDSVMAKALRPSEGEVLVGMYGSCRDSFERATELGMFKVLHFVNSIPTAHNEYLRELAGVSSSHHEMIPNWMAERVHDEVNLADLILTPSQFVARQFSQIQGSQKKVVVIPYGVNLGKFRSPETRPRRSRIRCLYVGQISYRKGIQDLLAAARRLSKLPIDFEVLGPVVSRELLLQFPENVRYGGSQLAGGVAMAMQESDVFVLPSYEDACALVTLEAMASGMPVVTTTHNGASELITHQIDGFVIDPGDPSRLADQLAELLDPQIRSDVGARAAAKARESLSWGAYGHAVMETIVRRRTRALG